MSEINHPGLPGFKLVFYEDSGTFAVHTDPNYKMTPKKMLLLRHVINIGTIATQMEGYSDEDYRWSEQEEDGIRMRVLKDGRFILINNKDDITMLHFTDKQDVDKFIIRLLEARRHIEND